MTHAQWMFEADAIRRMEQQRADMVVDVFKAAHRAFHDSMVRLLGLGIGAAGMKRELEKDGVADKDMLTPWVPMVISCGHPEVLSKLRERDQIDEALSKESEVGKADGFAAALMNADKGDLEPIFMESSNALAADLDREMKATLRAMGIVLAEDQQTDDPAAFANPASTKHRGVNDSSPAPVTDEPLSTPVTLTLIEERDGPE